MNDISSATIIPVTNLKVDKRKRSGCQKTAAIVFIPLLIPFQIICLTLQRNEIKHDMTNSGYQILKLVFINTILYSTLVFLNIIFFNF